MSEVEKILAASHIVKGMENVQAVGDTGVNHEDMSPPVSPQATEVQQNPTRQGIAEEGTVALSRTEETGCEEQVGEEDTGGASSTIENMAECNGRNSNVDTHNDEEERAT